MLIVVTRKCNEGCRHCMVNAVPTGEDMTIQTFSKSLEFAKKIGARIISISGGDPFLHPKIKEILSLCEKFHQKNGTYFVLESNGWWRRDDKMKEFIYRYLNKPWILGLQVSTNKLYYPSYNDVCQWFETHKFHSKLKFSKDWQGVETNLKYMGRAKHFMKEEDIKGLPGCLNIVSRSRIFKDSKNLKQLIHLMEESAHICTPVIYCDGSIRLGEGFNCKELTKVSNNDSVGTLFSKIYEFKPCDDCKSCKNLTKEQKEEYL